jgi:hypothetical protein
MAVDPTLHPEAYGWQSKQFAIDPNDPGAGTVVSCWAYPSAAAVAAALVNPKEEHVDSPTGGGYSNTGISGGTP